MGCEKYIFIGLIKLKLEDLFIILMKLKIDTCEYWDFVHVRVEEREEELRVVGWNLEYKREMKFRVIEMKYTCL